MDFSRFRFRAVVDWIELEIQTTKPTHFDAIKRHARLSYVKPMNAEPEGKTASIFRFRLYDPRNWQEVISTVSHVAEKFDLAKPFDVVGVEVALDAYSRVGTPLECAALVAHFAKFSTYTHENRRMYRMKGESFALPSGGDSLVRHLIAGFQIGVGDKDADQYGHAYLKVTDRGEPIKDSAKHRARIEITLRGDSLPCRTHSEWARYNFADLAKPYFSFRKLRTDLSKLMQVIADVNVHIGKRSKRNLRGGGTRLFSKLTVADSTLNGIARDKLRDLSDRWQAKKESTLAEIRRIKPPATPVATENQPQSLSTTYTDNNIQCSTIKEDSIQDRGNEAHSAECTDNYITELDSLRSSTLADEIDNFDDLLNQTPELEAELERINSLMDLD